MNLINRERPTRTDLYGSDMENRAVEYLKKKDYEILERNYKNVLGEIDIIAYDKLAKRLVFIEVKARKSIRYGYGREAINEAKIQKIRNSALMYLKSKNKLDEAIRFDCIEFMGDKVSHFSI